jgi:hypothetical protein
LHCAQGKADYHCKIRSSSYPDSPMGRVATRVDLARQHQDTDAFIHRFASRLYAYVHLQLCVMDGVFEAQPAGVAFTQPLGMVFKTRAVRGVAFAG